MPSTIAWLGTTDADFDTDANYVGGVKPSAGDHIEYAYGANPVDGEDESAVLYGNISVLQGFRGRLGSSPSSLLKWAAALVQINGGGPELFIGSGAPTGADWDECRIYGIGGDKGNGRAWLGASTPKMLIRAGQIYLLSGTITRMIVLPYAGLPAPAIYNHGATITTLEGLGGSYHQVAGAATTVFWERGDVTIDGGTAPTTIYTRNGANVIWNAGNISQIYSYGGIVDTRKSAAARTLTNGEVHGDGQIFIAPSVTQSNPIKDYTIQGGLVQVPTA